MNKNNEQQPMMLFLYQEGGKSFKDQWHDFKYSYRVADVRKAIAKTLKKNVNVYQRIAIQTVSVLEEPGNEAKAIKYNKLKISEAFPVFTASSKNNKIDRSKVTSSGGQGVGSSKSLNWSLQ